MSGLWGKGQGTFRGLMSSIFGGSKAPRHLLCLTDELQDGHMKEVSFEHSGRTVKVLISRVNGQYYATSHLCPHYKARLVTGVISGHRLTCPWHSACFDVRSGDIEEAPAVKALRTFPVEVEDDKVYLISDLADLEPGTRDFCERDAVECKGEEGVVVVVGGGAAGAIGAESMRVAGFKGKILVISKEPYLPIDRIKLSKVLSSTPDSIPLYKENYLDDIKIEYLLGKTVKTIDPNSDTVHLEDGKVIQYDKLLLAMGGEPRTLPIPGADLSGIFMIREAEGNQKLLATIEEYGKPKVVLIGASFMAMETAAMLSKSAESVSIVAPEAVPLERVLGVEVGTVLRKLHERNGIRFHLGVSIKAIHPRGDGNKVGSVELEGDVKLDADVVIMAVGVRPQTDCVKGILPLETDGSIKVDLNMKVLGTKNIYAAGDIATFPHRTSGSPIRIEHWDVAQQQGRIAGHNIVSTEQKPYKSVPFFFSLLFGKTLRYTGNAQGGYDSVYFDGDPEADPPMFAAYYIKGDAILAVATMARDPLAVHCGELMRLDRMPAASHLKSAQNPLDISLN